MTIPITVVAFQSVTPAKMTPAKLSRRISVAGNLPPAALKAHFRLILYYRAVAGEKGAALAAAAWIKDTLSVALTKEPVLAGRLRRDDGGDGGWEVRFNDAGVRLVQAAAAAELPEILDSGEREERERGLVYWKDVEKENTDQSALFYIQVTEFQGSGYSIGFSCSLLLTDPLFFINFLARWSHIHRQMITTNILAVDSMFHLSRFNVSPLPARLAATPTTGPPTTTVLRRRPSASYPVSVTKSSYETVGGLTMHSRHAGDLKVEVCGGGQGYGGGEEVRWEELGAAELVLGEGDVPVDVSYRIVTGGNERLVMVMDPGGGSDLLESITVPVPAKS